MEALLLWRFHRFSCDFRFLTSNVSLSLYALVLVVSLKGEVKGYFFIERETGVLSINCPLIVYDSLGKCKVVSSNNHSVLQSTPQVIERPVQVSTHKCTIYVKLY